MQPIEELNFIAQILFDKKGVNLLAVDVQSFSTLTSYFLLVEGTSDRHVRSMAQSVMQTLKDEKGTLPIHVEGLDDGDWVVLDYLDVVVHLQLPEVRERYRLEQLWGEGEVIDLVLEEQQSRIGKS